MRNLTSALLLNKIWIQCESPRGITFQSRSSRLPEREKIVYPSCACSPVPWATQRNWNCLCTKREEQRTLYFTIKILPLRTWEQIKHNTHPFHFILQQKCIATLNYTHTPLTVRRPHRWPFLLVSALCEYNWGGQFAIALITGRSAKSAWCALNEKKNVASSGWTALA